MTHRNSIDGFVPSNQGRHVGFGAPAARPSAGHHIRMRRPGLHTAPSTGNTEPTHRAPIAGQNLATSRLGSRNNFPEFTTYTATQSTGSVATGGTSGRVGDRPATGPSNAGGRQTGRHRKGRFGRNRHAGGAGDDRRTKKNGNRLGWKKGLKRTGIILAAIVLLAGGWFGWKIARTTSKVFGDDSSILGFLNSTPLKGEDKGRVNILLAGVSTDDPGHEGGNLTDSIMLISLDTKNHKAFMLSIPRDMWVNIPGYGHAKINAANAFGDNGNFSQPGYPSGGMGLLEEVVSNNFEVPIHYYAKINYSAFRDAVNAVGGISVNIQSEDPRGFYDPNISKVDHGPLKLANGVQTLDGQTALNFARARGDPTGDGRVAYGYAKSDFTRTQNQRLMMLALKDKVTSGGVITNPLKISELFDVVGKNMKTDLKPSEIRRLYDINKQTKGSDVESLSLNDAGGVNLLANYRSPDGESALAPAAGLDNFNQIQLYLKKVMTSDPVVKESAKVVVLNGGDINGLASKESNYLTSKGINVVAVDDAPHTTGANIILDQTTKKADGSSGKPATMARLKQIFGSDSGSSTPVSVGYPTADFIVILGTNQKAPQTTGSNN